MYTLSSLSGGLFPLYALCSHAHTWHVCTVEQCQLVMTIVLLITFHIFLGTNVSQNNVIKVCGIFWYMVHIKQKCLNWFHLQQQYLIFTHIFFKFKQSTNGNIFLNTPRKGFVIKSEYTTYLSIAPSDIESPGSRVVFVRDLYMGHETGNAYGVVTVLGGEELSR